jgi:retron-type reverse transcriptase
MIEGTVRHSVTGSPQGGIVSPMLSNIYLTAIDERYGRWSMHPREPSINAAARRVKDHKRGRPVFYMVRYADDFVDYL